MPKFRGDRIEPDFDILRIKPHMGVVTVAVMMSVIVMVFFFMLVVTFFFILAVTFLFMVMTFVIIIIAKDRALSIGKRQDAIDF